MIRAILPALLLHLSLLPVTGQAANNLDALPVVLPTTQQPLLQREAKISAQEYPLAQQLRPLLEQQEYHQAIQLLNEYKQEKSPALWLLEGQLHMQTANWQQAKLAFQQALKHMPDLVRAHLSLGHIYQSQDKPEQARAALSKAISLGANDANSFAMLGYLNMQLHDSHSAVAAYQQALMLTPENDDVRQGLLFALVNSRQFQAASHLLSSMLQHKPSDKKLWLQRANLAFQAKQEQQALSSIEVALRLGENSQAARQMAMQLHLTQQNYPRAVALAQTLLTSNQLHFAETDKLLSWLSRQQQWQQLANLLSFIEKNSKLTNARDKSRLCYHQANLALAQKKQTQAKAQWRKAIQFDPANSDALIALAKLASEQQAYAEAELYYQRAERLPGVALTAKLGRAQVYIDQLDYPAALSLLQQVLNDYPQRQDLQDNIRVLTSLVNNTL